MDKLYAIKIRQSDGTYGAAIPVSVLAENVDWNSTLSLVDILGQVDTSESIQDQINNLKNTRATQVSVNALDQKVDNAVEYITHNNEIADAREGADGTEYNTLKERLDSEYNDLQSKNTSSLIMVNEEPVSATKVVIETGEEDGIELAYQKDVDALEQKTDWFVTPEMFGAVGNGVTDDTTALSACFATGKVVVLRATYAVSGMLTYSGTYIFGGGKIKVLSLQAGVRSSFHITSSSCKIENIEIDCNNTAALGLWVTASKNVSIKNCYIHNTETAYYDDDISSCGIAIDNCESAEVCHCVIENINRSSGVAGTHGSTGIVVYATKTIRVYNNVINGVKSSTGLADCDGIYVTQVHDNVDNIEAIVENNRIIDCTGRFIKSQVLYTVVRNNFCLLTYTFVPNDRYFNCVSIQRGSFEIVNNYFDVNESIHRSYSRMFSLEIYNTIPRSGIIKGNTIVSIKSSQSNRWIRSYLTVVCTVENVHIDIDMSDNNFIGYSENMIEIATDYNLSGNIKVHHNTTYAYQVLDMLSGSVNNLGDVLLDVRYNDNTLQTSGTRFSDTSTLFKNLIYRYNRGIDETLNNYPLSYNDLVTFEGYYRGANPMTDIPSVIGRGDYLYLNKSAKVCEFYCGGNGKNGYIV